MKRFTDGGAEEFSVFHRVDVKTNPVGQQRRENTIVRPDKEVAVPFDGKDSAVAADARVDNCQVDRAGGEIAVVIEEDSGCGTDILGGILCVRSTIGIFYSGRE